MNSFGRAGWQDALERGYIVPQAPLEGDWSANSGYEVGRYLAEHDRTMTAIYAQTTRWQTAPLQRCVIAVCACPRT